MKIAIIGTNGLLSDQLGIAFKSLNMLVDSYGLSPTTAYDADNFVELNLIDNEPNYNELALYDLIIYASGAGIQSNKSESLELIYGLNAYVPINICNKLSQINYRGTFVTFGSYFELGENNIDTQFDEVSLVNSLLKVPNNYCISKRLLTKYVMSATQTFKHLHLILPTIYGPTEAPHRLIPYTIKSIKEKSVCQFTSGTQVRQYLYIGDLPQIILSLNDLKQATGIYNVSGDETLTVRQIVEQIYALYNTPITKELFGQADRADVGMQNLQIDDTKLRDAVLDIRYTPFSEVIKLYDQCF